MHGSTALTEGIIHLLEFSGPGSGLLDKHRIIDFLCSRLRGGAHAIWKLQGSLKSHSPSPSFHTWGGWGPDSWDSWPKFTRWWVSDRVGPEPTALDTHLRALPWDHNGQTWHWEGAAHQPEDWERDLYLPTLIGPCHFLHLMLWHQWGVGGGLLALERLLPQGF